MYSNQSPSFMQGMTAMSPHGLPMQPMGLMELDMVDLNNSIAMDDSEAQGFAHATLQGGDPTDSSTPALQNHQNMGNSNLIIGVGAGAGPLPTGFGMQNPSSTGSTLTEFTKRRNWSKLLLEELRDLMMILSPDGRIQHVSQSVKLLTGYDGYMLMGKLVSEFVHNDDKAMFVREFNESIASGHQLRFFYRFRKEDDTYTIFEALGHPHLTSDALMFGGGGGLPYCRGFFLMSRPYPTKNAALLDSFLEHKIENERLLKRIAELKQEEKDEEEELEMAWRRDGQSNMTPSESLRTGGDSGDTGGLSSSDAMPPPARPVSNIALTSHNLSQAQARARPDSISDKMARYEGANPLETIEMLTGLKYQEGERSMGLSTGAASPALIQGDAGIAIFADRDNRSNMDRKKKTKMADEYVCTDCGTLDSPEWRKGPKGPKTLCNACGLRWAKKEKKRQQPNKSNTSMLIHSSTES